ncbi:hypothetical protein HY947_01285 [Candidatus Gottesmanbacteria bacterium]|nr:hypothetical protein [Candidatus Gottesmanbacteria bacterium]
MPISVRDALLSFALRVLRLKSSETPGEVPGLLLIQIDGLSYEILQEAREKGLCPFLDSLIQKNTFTVGKYFSGIPSSTIVVDAELFYGTHEGIVSFTWIDRKAKKFRFGVNNVSIHAVEEELKKTHTPLMSGGSSLMFAYGAGASILDLSSSELDLHKIPQLIPKYRGIFVPLLNPIRFWKIFLVFLFSTISSVATSLFKRNFHYYRYTMIELLIKIFLNDYASVLTRIEIWRGTPKIALNICLYDHVSHVHGIRHHLTMQALKLVDFYCRELYLSLVRSKRKYSLIVLSDHGQADARLFRHISGESIDRVVASGIGDDSYTVGVKHVGATFGEKEIQAAPDDLKQVFIMACGDTAQIYFSRSLDMPMNKEVLDAAFPKLIKTLLFHKGIGWILVRSGTADASLLSREGGVFFENGKVKKIDKQIKNIPPERILDDLGRYSKEFNIGDLVIFGAVLDGKAACFEEHEPHGAHAGFNAEEPWPFMITNAPAVIKALSKGEPSKEELFRSVRSLVSQV